MTNDACHHQGTCPSVGDLTCRCGNAVWRGYDGTRPHRPGMCGPCAQDAA